MPEPEPGRSKTLDRALGLLRAGELAAALRLVEEVLAGRPQSFDALHLLGLIELRRGRLPEAERAIARAVAIQPGFAPAHLNRARALAALGRAEEAVESYDKALALKPDNAEAQFRRANLLRGLNRLADALAGFERAVALDPGHAAAWNNRGVVLKALGRLDQAVESYDRALAAKPDFAEAAANRGLALADLNRHDRAAGDFELALKIDPDFDYAPGLLAHSRMHCCDWRHIEADIRRLTEGVRAGMRATHPFPFLALSGSAGDQLACARIWARDNCPPSPAPLWRGERYAHDRIRVAYLSADFYDHATMRLAAGLFECHDRSRFETAAISFGPDAPGPMRDRLEAAFGRFEDMRRESDAAIARRIRDLEIDIAVDLKGPTKDARSRVLAMRPAPLQVAYLGFPGTMGAEFIDYIVADRVVIPDAHIGFYAEQVVHLPGSYQANDRARRIGAAAPSRAEAGLPAGAFVFCSFNSAYKITPPMFDLWMRLLAIIDGSVLWLLRSNAAAEDNLRREAKQRRVDPERLAFAPVVPPEDHLARHRLADLFLDTLPCNAHTTASDALWAGLPVLTCRGEAFAGRVGASLLGAAGLPELVAGSLEEYEALALKLAADRALLAATKAKLKANRLTCALFDTAGFTRRLERAYETMWERWQRGEPPRGFAVEPVQGPKSSL
ncbi:MAG: O-linked N-acetylglucosamine transferase, SPINDLY family protein [Rhodospirillales bacterium]